MSSRVFVRTLMLLAGCTALASCYYQHPRTQAMYQLHTEYETFQIDDDPNTPVTNFIGFCLMPMQDAQDPRSAALNELLDYYLTSNGYVRVEREELVAEPRLVPETFLVGMSYVQSFAYGTIQLQMNLYQIEPETKQNEQIYSWKAKFDGYPVLTHIVEPAFEDLFCAQPFSWPDEGTMFPCRGRSTNDVERFKLRLGAAKMRVQSHQGQTEGQ